MEKIELLAPAGDLERLKIALLYGADAVYVGGSKLGLRANATNFTKKELQEAVEFAHSLNKKVHLTINIVFHDEDREEMDEYLEEMLSTNVDAVIVSDPYLMDYIIKKYPQVEVHVSTQASTTNYQAVNFYKELGAKRVVLAREVGKSDIEKIVSKTNMDIEVFIHGAMCTCYSGRCALSNYLTNRDANRGGCAQVCRFLFKTSDEKFTMATKDLNMAKYIKDLIEMGVKSLKVEGRMRSLYYLATVIGSYRALIDAYYNNSLTSDIIEKYQKILTSVANRESTSQYFLHEADEEDQYYTGRQEISNQEYLGLVIGYNKKDKRIIIRERNYFKKNDTVELFTMEGDSYIFKIDKIYTEDDELIDVARHPDEVLEIPFEKEVSNYSMLRLIEKG